MRADEKYYSMIDTLQAHATNSGKDHHYFIPVTILLRFLSPSSIIGMSTVQGVFFFIAEKKLIRVMPPQGML